jgi:hypothetical protein
MALSINFSDKVIAGLWQSYTITSDEGPPEGEVVLEGKPLDRRIIPMREPLWKVTFLLPKDSGGKELVLRFKNRAAAVEEKKAVEALPA